MTQPIQTIHISLNHMTYHLTQPALDEHAKSYHVHMTRNVERHDAYVLDQIVGKSWKKLVHSVDAILLFH